MPPKRFAIYPIPSPDDIIKNKNYTETKQIISDVEKNINNFLSRYNNIDTHKKMRYSLKFIKTDLISALNRLEEDEERIWDHITDVLYNIIDEDEHKMDFEAKKELLSNIRMNTDPRSKRTMVKDLINKYAHDYQDAEFFERLMLIYDNHENSYFVFAANIVKFYNNLVEIYRIHEDNKAKQAYYQPDPTECDKCDKDTNEVNVCPVVGKECLGGTIVDIPVDWNDSSWFYSY